MTIGDATIAQAIDIPRTAPKPISSIVSEVPSKHAVKKTDVNQIMQNADRLRR